MADEDGLAGPPSPFSLAPTSFAITLRLDQEQTLPLTLTNTSSSYAAFKVKTTNPDRYLVRPTQDIVKPGESKVCKIILAKVSELPDPSNSKAFRDKFLVQSLPLEDIPPTTEDLARLWKERERVHNARRGTFAYSEQILRCKLSLPAPAHTEAPVARPQGLDPALQQAPSVSDGKQVEHPRPQPWTLRTLSPYPTSARGKAAPPDARPSLPHAVPLPVPLPVPPPDATASTTTQLPVTPHTAASADDPAPAAPTAPPDDHREARRAEAMADDSEKQQEMEEMMTYLVKLTSENAKLKQEVQALSQRHNQTASSLEAFQKRNAELEARLAEEGAVANPGGLRRRGEAKSGSPADAAFGDTFSASNTMQWWHLAAIAMLFFLIGKLS